jgi:hypothetical protein
LKQLCIPKAPSGDQEVDDGENTDWFNNFEYNLFLLFLVLT